MGGLDDLIGSITEGKGGGGLGDLLGGLAGGGSGGGLGDLLGQLTGGEGGGDGGGPGGMGGLLAALLPAVGGLLANGGLQKVLAGLQQSGLGAQASSWIGTGSNEAISGAEVEQAVGHDAIAGIAAQLGLSEADAAEAVAQVLPVVVDRVSPEGELPPDDELEAELRKLGGPGAPSGE